MKLAVVSFTADSFRPRRDRDRRRGREPTSRRTRTTSRFPRSARSSYLLIDVEALRAKIVVPPADIERAYNDNIEQYTTPEQVRASHILLKTEGKDDAAVKAQGRRRC